MSDKEKELEELINEAETGKDIAAKKIYESFITNMEMDKDLRIKARDYFLKKTENLEECDPNISYYCGCMLNHNNLPYIGIGGDKSREQAINCLISSANKGNLNSNRELFSCSVKILNLPDSQKKVTDYFNNKIENNPSANDLYWYGEMLKENYIKRDDEKKAIDFFMEAAENNSSEAVKELYDYINYNINNDSEKEKIETVKNYFNKNSESPDVLFYRGLMFQKGKIFEKNEKEATNCFIKAVEKGNSKAIANLHDYIIKNNNKEEEITKNCINCIKEQVEKGNSEAIYTYGKMLLNGDGVEKNEKEATNCFIKAAEKGNSKAIANLHDYIIKNNNKEEEITKNCINCIKEQVEKGNSEAIYTYGKMLLNGDGVEKNEKEAANFLKKAADLKNGDAMREYGCMLRDGIGVKQDLIEAEKCFYRASKITPDPKTLFENYLLYKNHKNHINELYNQYDNEKHIENEFQIDHKLNKRYFENKEYIIIDEAFSYGSPDAKFELACLFSEGTKNNYIEKDEARSLKYLKELINENNNNKIYNNSLNKLVDLSLKNDDFLTQEDKIEYYEKAADIGNDYAKYKLAEFYKDGIGVKKDKEKADRFFEEVPNDIKNEFFKSYKKLLKNGDDKAMHSVARCYENGIGTKQDLTKAKNLYRDAADKGNIEAMYNVARCYEKRIGTKNKFKPKYYEDKALEYYKKAADLNHAEAAFKVAESYFKIDKKEAIKYYKIAANQDHAEAAFTLGQFYEFGDPTRETGINVNLKEATKYYKIAADQGNEIAQKRLAELNQKLNEQSKIKPVTKTADPSESITNMTTESKKPKESKEQEDNKLASKTPNKSNIKVEQNSVEIVERSVDIETNPTVKNPDKTTINNKGDKEVKTSLNSPEKKNSLTESTDPSAILRSINDKLINISDENLKNIAKELKKPEKPEKQEELKKEGNKLTKNSFNELKNKIAEKLGTNTRNFKEHKNLTEEQLKEAEERNKNNDGVKWTEHTENSNRWYKSDDESWKEKENIGDDPIKRKENRDKTMRQIREENGQDIDNEPGPENLSFSQKVNIINNGGKIPKEEIKQENNLSTEPEEKTTVTDLNTSSSSVNTESSDNSDTLTSKEKNDTPTNTEPTKSSINNEKLSEAAEAAKILNDIGIKKDNGKDFTEDDMMPDKIEESIRPILEGFNENFNEYEKNGGNPKISNYNMYKDSVILFNKKNNVKVIKNDETGAIKEIRIKDPDNEAKTEIIDFEQNYDSLGSSRSRIGYITTFSNQSVKNNPLNTAEGIKELKEYMDKNSINKNIKVNKEVNEPEPIQPKPEPKEELEDKEQKEKDDFRVSFFNLLNSSIKEGVDEAKTLKYKNGRAEFYNENGEQVKLENIQSGELLKQTVGNLNNFLHNERNLFDEAYKKEASVDDAEKCIKNTMAVVENINKINESEIKFNEIKNKVNNYKKDFEEDFEKKYETVTAAAVDENTYNNINTNEEIEKEKEELNKKKDELKQKYEEYKKQIDEKSDEISNKEKESENIVKDCEEFTGDNISPFNSNEDTTKLNDKFKNLNNSLQVEDLNINLEGLKIEMTELKAKQEALSKQEEKIKTQQQFSFKDNNPKSNLDKQVMAIAADTVNIDENDLLSKNDDLENQCEKIFGERNIEAEGEKNTRKHKELQRSINKLNDNQKINYAKRMEDLIGYSLDHPDKKIDIDYCEKQRLYLIKCKNNKEIGKISKAGIGSSITELSENYRKTIGEKSLGLESKVEDIKPEDFYPKGTKISKEEQEKYNFTKFTVENIAEDEEDKFKNYSINLKYSKNVNTVDLMAYIRENGFEAAKEKYKDQGLDFVIRDKNGKEVGEKEKKEILEKLQPKDRDKLMEIKKNKEQKKNNSLSPEGQQVQQTLDKNGLHKNSVTSTGQDISINNVKSNAISSEQQTKKASLNNNI